jgi:hypothetical protein
MHGFATLGIIAEGKTGLDIAENGKLSQMVHVTA